jgi:peptidoglycan/LPS O-acetylase OafA/YrhL
VAALVVVLHHSLLATPALAATYLVPTVAISGAASWLVYSPLHLGWDGGLAVYIFFILSGFVLTVPATIRSIRWRSYYPSRLIRLYVPTFGAVLFSALLAALVLRTVTPGSSWWVNSHADSVRFRSVMRDALLLGGTDSLNSALWTLRWEVFFSLLLPLYLIIGRRSGSCQAG